MPAVTMPSYNSSTVSRTSKPSSKPVVLHLGDPVKYNTELYDHLDSQFDIINPSASDLERPAFLNHLRNKEWGDFVAIMRPFWNTGGEMGRWDRELVDLLPKGVKVYASAGAGYDWVDTDVLAEHGILYCNSRGASTEAVADMALYHIISVFRCMTISHLAARSLSAVQFNDAHYNLPVRSHNPRGHTLGIIGLGDIGFAIAKKVEAALGMRILYNDIVRKELQEQEVSATFCPNLETMLSESDCVLIATPFAGKQLVTADLLRLFKPGSRLVNIARGSLIDEDALAEALEEGKLTAVGMDVHAQEPTVNERLAQNWNVTMTSHNGGGAFETIVGFERLAMENVDAVLNGREPLSAVNAYLIHAQNGTGPVNESDTHGSHNGTNGYTTNGEHVNDHPEAAQDTNGHMTNGHMTNGQLVVDHNEARQDNDGQMTNGHATNAGHEGERQNGTTTDARIQNDQMRNTHTSIIGGV